MGFAYEYHITAEPEQDTVVNFTCVCAHKICVAMFALLEMS